MARWRVRPESAVPARVLDAWVHDDDPDGRIDAWLDDLWDRDKAAWDVALITLLSTPSYARPR